MHRAFAHFLGLLVLALSQAVAAKPSAQASCKLEHPIVLSHHWGMKRICAKPDTSGPLAGLSSKHCEQHLPAKQCLKWSVLEAGQASDSSTGEAAKLRCTGGWGASEAELDLPPRNVNHYQKNLIRNVSAYQRYFSLELVNALKACGNAVFLSDKPAFASYHHRAVSLRNTVLEALESTGASKVVIIGHSQGSQDARYMTGVLPVSETSPEQGSMKQHVAAVVSVAGEPGGALSSDVGLNGLYATNVLAGSGWLDYERDPLLKATGLYNFNSTFWKQAPSMEQLDPVYVLYEHAPKPLQNLSLQQRYASYLTSVAQLSSRYMSSKGAVAGFDSLTQTLGIGDHWGQQVPVSAEADNGVTYLSYAAYVKKWQPGWDSAQQTTHRLLEVLAGANDAFVTESAQRFDLLNLPNFTHVHTLESDPSGRGYHHMFFSGEDPSYGPQPEHQDPYYPGGTTDVYVQILKDLNQAGF